MSSLTEKYERRSEMLILDMMNQLINDEARGWEYVLALRRTDVKAVAKGVKIKNRREALERGIVAVKEIMKSLSREGLDFDMADPGHGLGHIARDYINALILCEKLNCKPVDTLVGFVAGVVHDLGCCIYPRYVESTHAVRHAEACAIMLYELFKHEHCGLTAEERVLVQYAVAAHTHYTRPSIIHCSDGVDREILPYTDTDEDGAPILAVWIPRWIDRLDTNGAAFPGRHFLTLGNEHDDFDRVNQAHYRVSFRDHMRPVLRRPEVRGSDPQTMLEHMNMFLQSQNNRSPFGKHDFGQMVKLRDRQSARLKRVIDAVTILGPPVPSAQMSVMTKRALRWLETSVEPTPLGKKTANDLIVRLIRQSSSSWLYGFSVAAACYQDWAAESLVRLSAFSQDQLCFNAWKRDYCVLDILV